MLEFKQMIILILIVAGLIFGSFVNALVWRLHEQEHTQENKAKSRKKRATELSILKGRSICTHCGHQLASKDLVPVLSWLSLKGKCRYCHKPISWQYPVVELLTVGLFIFSYLFWPVPMHSVGLFTFMLWLVFLVGFIALSVYDLRWFVLPNRIVYPLILLALLQLLIILAFFHGGFNAFIGAFWGALIASGIFYLLFQISKGQWIGGGDVKLGALLGILVGGPFASILLLFVASASGTLLSLPFLLTGQAKRNTKLPFGPLLIVGAIVARLFGASIYSHFRNSGL
jgi:leader peptidase (prepilin peptidase) / N-methyltransferase